MVTNSTCRCASKKCMGSSFQTSVTPLISFNDFILACKKIFVCIRGHVFDFYHTIHVFHGIVFPKIKGQFLSNLENSFALLPVELVGVLCECRGKLYCYCVAMCISQKDAQMVGLFLHLYVLSRAREVGSQAKTTSTDIRKLAEKT